MRIPRSDRTVKWLLLVMVLLQIAFLVVRGRPYGAAGAAIVRLVVALSVAAGLVVALLPESAVQHLRALASAALRTRGRALLVLLVSSAAVLGASAYTQQLPSWDEAHVYPAALLVAAAGVESLLDRYGEIAWLGQQHPPLVPLLYGFAMRILGYDPMVTRLVDAAFGCATVLVAYLIVEVLYGRRVAFVASLLLLASPLFVRIGSAATNDMPLTFFFCLAIWLALEVYRLGRTRLALPLAVAIAAGIMTKYTMVLAYPIVLGVAIVHGTVTRLARHAFWIVGLPLAVLLGWLLLAEHIGVLVAQQRRLGWLAGVATTTPRGRRWAFDAALTKMPSALGFYTLPIFLLGLGSVLRLATRADRLLVLWIALVCLPLLVTLPDNRYFLPAFPAFTAVMAIGLERRPGFAVRVIALAWLLCAVVILFYSRIDLSQAVFLFRNR